MEAERIEILHDSPEDASNVHQEGQNITANTQSSTDVQSVSRISEQPTRETASSHSTVDPKSNLKTLYDRMTYFGVFPLCRQLWKFANEVIKGKMTVEEFEAGLKGFDEEIQKLLYHKYDPDTVKMRGGSEEELNRAQELQEKMNQTLRFMKSQTKIMLDKIVEVSAFFPHVMNSNVAEVNEALQFAHAKKMHMVMHLDRATGEDRITTEKYRDFYSWMEQSMGDVLKERQGADHLVAALYGRLLYLFEWPDISEKELVWLENQRFERNRVVRMCVIAHHVTLKQENARLKKSLEKLLQKIEGEDGALVKTGEAANEIRDLLAPTSDALKDLARACTETVPEEIVLEAEKIKILHDSPEDASNAHPEEQNSTANTSSSTDVQSGSRTSEQPTKETASSNSTVDPKPKLKTLNDHLRYFGVFPLCQQLWKLAREVMIGTMTVEEFKAELEGFDEEIQKLLYHKYDPDTVKMRGGSEEELNRAQELQKKMNKTMEALNLLNIKTLGKLAKVSAFFPDVTNHDVDTLNHTLQFARSRSELMETHLQRASGSEKKLTERYNDFYLFVIKFIDAVLEGRCSFPDRMVASTYFRFLNLIEEWYLWEKRLVWFFIRIRLLRSKQEERLERSKVVRMFVMVHRVILKQENSRLKKGLEKLLPKIEGEDGVLVKTEEAAEEIRDLLGINKRTECQRRNPEGGSA